MAQLFNEYRQFYGLRSDLPLANEFISERLSRHESVILVAEDTKRRISICGFVQLYPSFSSLAPGRIWILNDLYVARPHRRTGVGRALMNAAREYARATGACRVVLATGVGNQAAQALYESLGYARDADSLLYYTLELR